PGAGAGLAVGAVGERVVAAEALCRLAAADAAGDVVLAVDEVVPEGADGGLVVDVVGALHRIGHGGIGVDGADGVSDDAVLLGDGEVGLVILAAEAVMGFGPLLLRAAAIEQEAG